MRRLASLGLSLLLAGLAVIAIAVIAVPAITGTQPVTIDRASMQEVLPQGSLAYIRASTQYTVGDWVTFRRDGNVITHEVVELHPNPATAERDGLWLQTKGTHNPEPDPYPISRDQIIGRVVYHLPVAGSVLQTIDQLPLQLFIALSAIGLYWLSTSGRPKRAPDTYAAIPPPA